MATNAQFFEQERERDRLTRARTGKDVEPRRPQGGAGMELVDICERCFEPFAYVVSRSGMQRGSVEYELLRRVLKIKDHTFYAVVCDPCFAIMTQSNPFAEQESIPPGTSNCAPPNLCMRGV